MENETKPVVLKAITDRCPLCPSKPGAPPTDVPEAAYQIVVLDNRFAALRPDPPDPSFAAARLRRQSWQTICRRPAGGQIPEGKSTVSVQCGESPPIGREREDRVAEKYLLIGRGREPMQAARPGGRRRRRRPVRRGARHARCADPEPA